jgi:uncharacterized Rmd1/YagE family protein
MRWALFKPGNIPHHPSSMTEALFPGSTRVHVRALFVGERIDVRAFERAGRIAESPLLVRAGSRGCAVLFRYGAVVLFELPPLEELAFLTQLGPQLNGGVERPESEEAELLLSAGGDERVDISGAISLTDASMERLQLVAEVLAKSVVLAYYERQVAQVFDTIEPLAAGLRTAGRFGARAHGLLNQIGEVLMVEHKMVGRVEVTEKPDLLWDHPQLERLYARLVDEYELSERHRALERKLELISRTAETVLGLVQARRSLRVEWYIVVLILVEILLTLYDKFLSG